MTFINIYGVTERQRQDFESFWGRPMTSQEEEFVAAYDEREALAIGPGEFYMIGFDEVRESRLATLTEQLKSLNPVVTTSLGGD